MEYKKQQTTKLVDLSKTKAYQNEYLVRKVILSLIQAKETISINKVAECAGISRQVIYSNPKLKALVDHYRIYVQKLIIEPVEINGILMDIPSINYLELEVDELLKINKELNQEILELEISVYELDQKIEKLGDVPEYSDMFRED